ncbi:MAG TPA: TlpA disulfide reductase family protein [Planctomycetota bacterium]|nr:TlpA disulfide reductase family protein [Planctomycetota bacterium]
MKPHLVRWHGAYAEKGLTIIDVDDGSQDTLADLKKEVEHDKLPFPILWDKDGKNVAAYKVEGMPAAYLIGVEGTVIWEGHPNARQSEADKLEARIKAELEKVKK